MKIEDPFAELAATSFAEGALSAYLVSTPASMDARHHALALEALARAERPYLNAAETSILERELPRAVNLLAQLRLPARQPLALFAASTPETLEVWRLRDDPEPVLRVGRRAHLEAIRRQLAAHPPALILLADKERARLFLSVLENVEEIAERQGDTVDHHRQGGWSDANFQRHVEMHATWNLEAAAHWLVGQRWDFASALYIGGPPEAMAVLRRRLPADARARMAGELQLPLYASAGELREALREAVA